MSKHSSNWYVLPPTAIAGKEAGWDKPVNTLERWGWALGKVGHWKADKVRLWRCYRNGTVLFEGRNFYVRGKPMPIYLLKEMETVCKRWIASITPSQQTSLLGARKRSRRRSR